MPETPPGSARPLDPPAPNRARVLLIDNYDSFTYNLVQALRGLGAEVIVIRNDRLTIDEALALRPTHLVVSPGPGRPEDAGISVAALIAFHGRVPILGVCLGHQALGVAFGGRVVPAARLMHGKPSPIRHDGRGVYRSLPETIQVGRYHSLAIPESGLPAGFLVTARSDDGEIMGVRHERLPIEGVQFHPESVLTPEGPRMLASFLGLDDGVEASWIKLPMPDTAKHCHR